MEAGGAVCDRREAEADDLPVHSHESKVPVADARADPLLRGALVDAFRNRGDLLEVRVVHRADELRIVRDWLRTSQFEDEERVHGPRRHRYPFALREEVLDGQSLRKGTNDLDVL